MKNLVMVTGANGFIGYQVVQSLLDKNMEILATYYSRKPQDTKNVNWIGLDVHEHSRVAEVIRTYRPEYLIHCAWHVNPEDCLYSVKNLGCMEDSLALFRAFYEYGGVKAIFTGTCFEYDLHQESMLSENALVRPVTLYGTAKANLADTLTFYSRASQIPFVWARLFYMYGQREYPQRVFPYVIRSLLNRQQAFVSHGNQIRDYSYVSDIANALTELLQLPFSGIINIGSGNGVALKDVFRTIEKQIGYNGVVYGGRQVASNEPKRVVADTTLLNSLGIRMKTPIGDGLQECIAYWKQQAKMDR